MEKKGEIFNQLAIISDLLENTNLESDTKTVIFTLDKDEFEKIFLKTTKKVKIKSETEEKTFSIKIGVVDFVFNMNNA